LSFFDRHHIQCTKQVTAGQVFAQYSLNLDPEGFFVNPDQEIQVFDGSKLNLKKTLKIQVLLIKKDLLLATL
jgi:hypothetical protein